MNESDKAAAANGNESGNSATLEGEDDFLLEGPNNTHRITPFDPAFEKKMPKAEEIMARYRNTLHVLAK